MCYLNPANTVTVPMKDRILCDENLQNVQQSLDFNPKIKNRRGRKIKLEDFNTRPRLI
jgi:hypothetical protein